MTNPNNKQHKPPWDRNVLLSDFGNFDKKRQQTTMKNVLFDSHLRLKFLKLDKNIGKEKAKTRSRFYKFLIKGEKSTVYNTRYKTLGV